MQNPGLTYIIADDDPVYLELTIQQLNLIPGLECLAACDSALEVITQLQNGTPHILILDVEMPGLTGIQLAKSLVDMPMIIFISSHKNYAVEAFEVDAIDYLVKPVAPHRLIRSIEKARHLHNIKCTTETDEGFKRSANDTFFIKENGSFVKINYSSVIYIESLGDFVTIYLEGGDKKIALVNIKSLEQQLPSENFTRISRKHMVNKEKVTALDSNNVMLQNIQLHIGKTFTEQVIEDITGSSLVKRFVK